MLCSAAFANPIDLLKHSTSEAERREDGFITVSLKQAQVFSHPTSYECLQRSTEMREVRERTTNHYPKQPIPKTGADVRLLGTIAEETGIRMGIANHSLGLSVFIASEYREQSD
ncbi:hypothetical protein Moror_4355 [Moniliophthora roreri MCA 2997]|uniref:Uncharacterized protein n=1 Tax=Moniliophthora roreri (strain MCA 2997) TaxID=1381753 RepID=V2XI81_MONRO|nr:hypothetical protein Moror_4355 [Moniliophthora roreri MCA 2997]